MASENDDRKVTLTDSITARSAHVSVSGRKFMLIWGGYTEVAVGERYLNPSDVNIYHIEHRYWTRHTSVGDIPLGTSGASACFVQGFEYLFLFGGHTAEGNTNCLYRLFCFGGFGPPLDRNLNHSGKFITDTSTHWPTVRGWNNQLLEYDIRTEKWSNPKCKGSVPLPRAACAAVRLGSEVYLFGGRHLDKRMNDLHCFSLKEYAWSGELHMEGACPCGRSWHTLTAVSDNMAFLYGGYSNEGIPLSDAWQLNATIRQWTQMTVPLGRCRLWHTSCCSEDGEILVFGGCCSDLLDYSSDAQHSNEVLSFHLQPYRLRRLCLEAAYEYRNKLQEQWAMLPRELADWLQRHSEIERLKSNHRTALNLQKQGSTCTVS